MTAAKFQRNTRQREAILEELRRMCSHPTAAELHAAVREQLPRISLGTVYRNLELLVEMGQVRKLEVGGEARFDGNLEAHSHFRCERCGRLNDLYGPPVELDLTRVNQTAGCQITGYRLDVSELFG